MGENKQMWDWSEMPKWTIAGIGLGVGFIAVSVIVSLAKSAIQKIA